MKRAIYTAPPFPSYVRLFFGSSDPEPVEVELVEYVGALARIVVPTPEHSILGIAARSRGRTGPLPGLERLVPAEHVREIDAEA